MPELPEVEVTRRSFAEQISGAQISSVFLGKPLRWPLGVEPESLVGRKIGDSLWAVYASAAYLARIGRPERVEDFGRHDWVGLDESLGQHRAALWLKQVAPGAHIVARNNSVLGLAYSAKAGLGLAPLPTPLGDAEPELVRVLGPIPELTRIWRVLTTPELRRTPRVAAFFDFMVEEMEALRPIITG